MIFVPSKRMLTFFDLPPEIRLLIDREVLESSTSIDILNLSFCYRALVPVHRHDLWPQILRTSRRLHQEAIPILYSHAFCLRIELHIQDALHYYDSQRATVQPGDSLSFSTRDILLRKQCEGISSIYVDFQTVRPRHHWLKDGLLDGNIRVLSYGRIQSQLTQLKSVQLCGIETSENSRDWIPAAGGDISLANAFVKLMSWYKRSIAREIEHLASLKGLRTSGPPLAPAESVGTVVE